VLRQHLQLLSFSTSGAGFTNITTALNAAIAASGLHQGVATLVCLHTSCSLTVNENADPRVLEDLAAGVLEQLAQLEIGRASCRERVSVTV
jgi:thiamine phosphate synthase YjbQ (UPF0047 family)